MGVIQYKKLENLSFEDLYVELPEQTYPELRAGIKRAASRLHIKWVGLYAVDAYRRLFHAPSFPRARIDH